MLGKTSSCSLLGWSPAFLISDDFVRSNESPNHKPRLSTIAHYKCRGDLGNLVGST